MMKNVYVVFLRTHQCYRIIFISETTAYQIPSFSCRIINTAEIILRQFLGVCLPLMAEENPIDQPNSYRPRGGRATLCDLTLYLVAIHA